MLLRKGFTVGILFLLIGMSFIPSTGSIVLKNYGQPDTVYIDDDFNSSTPGWGYDHFDNIQDGIDAVNESGTVYVYNGTYNESLIINKSINLIGENKDNTIIDYQNTSKINQNNIVFIEADNCTIKELKIIGNGTTSSDSLGININASYNTVSNNILLNNYRGVYIGENSKNNNVALNIVSNNWYGISTRFSDNNNILKNNISLNGLYGIYLSVSDNNNIFGNTISDNFYGMRIKNSDSNNVFDNIIIMNKRGMYICCGAGNNMIYYNTFKQNSEWNAHDDSVNQWDNGNFGNYWDDYTGLDNDSNGIGDIPYDIPDGSGGSINEDRYPLMYPWYPTHPDIVYVDDDYNISTPGFGYDRFNRIQYGVNEVKEKGEIYVFNGTYFENVIVDKSINLIGENKNTTFIDGGGKNVIKINAKYVNITDFTLQNSKEDNGGGIRINPSCGYAIIKDNIIKDNHLGIHLYRSNWGNNEIKKNTIINNNVGISIVYSTGNFIFKNYVSNNSWGIQLFFSTRNEINQNVIEDNGPGLQLYESGGNLMLLNTFRNSTPNAFVSIDFNYPLIFKNTWLLNYWERPRLLPKPILTRVTTKIGFTFPIFTFDWRPALKPYDI